ncbi:hypothetical protein N7478_001759 [Penicillium angulare]|nr:hypothetical protein N7478_001759 [Penicillium angulare]
MIHFIAVTSTYDHRVWRTGLPVRSAVLKPHAGQFVGFSALAALLFSPFSPIHLNALNTTILPLNILHMPEPLTWPSPCVLTSSR